MAPKNPSKKMYDVDTIIDHRQADRKGHFMFLVKLKNEEGNTPWLKKNKKLVKEYVEKHNLCVPEPEDVQIPNIVNEDDISDLVKVQMAYQDFIDLHSEPLPETNEYIVMLKKMIKYYTEEEENPTPKLLPKRRMGGWTTNVDEHGWPLNPRMLQEQRASTTTSDESSDVYTAEESPNPSIVRKRRQAPGRRIDLCEPMGNIHFCAEQSKNKRFRSKNDPPERTSRHRRPKCIKTIAIHSQSPSDDSSSEEQ
uniref:Chromo domain-containing protein n=1 Tax=Rhabditophanes sp. KR3021 TaxID=114890 RepID=A0AC35TZP9_9BILA